MCSINHVQKCNCGAYTVTFEDGATNSMPKEIFAKNFPRKRSNQTVFCCDYCVNKWGVDLCGCGSGEKVGKCSNDYYECQNNIPAQVLGEQKETELWAR